MYSLQNYKLNCKRQIFLFFFRFYPPLPFFMVAGDRVESVLLFHHVGLGGSVTMMDNGDDFLLA